LAAIKLLSETPCCFAIFDKVSPRSTVYVCCCNSPLVLVGAYWFGLVADTVMATPFLLYAYGVFENFSKLHDFNTYALGRHVGFTLAERCQYPVCGIARRHCRPIFVPPQR
jgi:hypothetical protein